MEELYIIMREFLEVEYNLESMLYLIDTLEAFYNMEEHREAALFANGTRYYMTALRRELKDVIGRLDTFLAAQVKE